jgi:hypothetical protein
MMIPKNLDTIGIKPSSKIQNQNSSTNKKGWFLPAFFMRATNCRATICHIALFVGGVRIFMPILAFFNQFLGVNLWVFFLG